MLNAQPLRFFFRKLVAFSHELNEEEKRAIRQNLSKEVLTIFVRLAIHVRAKKVFIATMHFGHVFRIQCPDDRCKNLGEYMTNSIQVKDTRSN